MWQLPIFIIIVAFLIYLTAATTYLLFLAWAYFFVPEPTAVASLKINRFIVLIPAHNEELLIPRLCDSLLRIDYPREHREIYVVADNCSDRTAEICAAYPVHVLIREDPSQIGKGFAIRWALDHIPLQQFDALFMVDADNVVDPSILSELNLAINHGEQAIQCCNSVGNRDESWFTQLLFVSRTVGNLLYHHSKFKLGLSSYLMGNGICFKAALLKERGWTAFTVGEDWEYYAQLIDSRIKIGFAVKAVVFHQESKSLDQATSQRLRWASGRFDIAKRLGVKLLVKGLRTRDWFTLDASLPLIFPNYSLQVNLTIFNLLLCCLLPASAFKTISLVFNTGLLFSEIMLFVAGTYLAGSYWQVFKAVLHAPAFLVWKMVIDLLSITGLYRGNKWERTKRHVPLE